MCVHVLTNKKSALSLTSTLYTTSIASGGTHGNVCRSTERSFVEAHGYKFVRAVFQQQGCCQIGQRLHMQTQVPNGQVVTTEARRLSSNTFCHQTRRADTYIVNGLKKAVRLRSISELLLLFLGYHIVLTVLLDNA